MRTQAIALVVLIFSGPALAQDPLGNDSGPNANDGQCDDTRFENIGAGNSNIVFWEGGRYDRRDATDCRDLLLQGLINWRDGVDPRVEIVLATGDFGDDSGPNANDGQCDDARFENIGAGNSNIVFWEGGRYDGRDATDCADLLLQGLIAWRRDTATAVGPAALETPAAAEAGPETDIPECQVGSSPRRSFLTCLHVERRDNGDVVQTPFVNGLINGVRVERRASGTVIETQYVNHRMHGTRVIRWGQGGEIQTTYVEGVRHGTRVERQTNGRVTESTFVNGERGERNCVAGCD